MEGIDEGLLDPQGIHLSTTVYFEYDYANDQVTRRSVYVVMCFVVSAPISWSRKMQGTIET